MEWKFNAGSRCDDCHELNEKFDQKKWFFVYVITAFVAVNILCPISASSAPLTKFAIKGARLRSGEFRVLLAVVNNDGGMFFES